MKRSFVVFLLALGVALSSSAQEIRLAPVDPEAVGDWAKPALPFRLHPTLDRDVEYQGPALPMRLWGDLSLGSARYALVLGVSETGAAGLWLDQNRDDVIAGEELLSGGRGDGCYLWQVELVAEIDGENAYTYPLGLLWPEGRGYIYLIGGAPRIGTIASDSQGHTLVLVDGDINGVFGTEGDFYAVDVDADGTIYGDADGHEHFAIDEAFTLGERSFQLAQVSPAGSWVRLEQTEYVPPKLPLTPGHPAPDFTFTTLRDGRRLSLSDFQGKVVLLDFWATWCEPCMAELPNVKEIYKKYHDRGFEIIGISLDTSESALRSELQKQGITWPQYYDGKGWDNQIAALYRVFAIPATFLLDREGIIRYRDLRGQELADKVAELLAEPAPEEAPPPVKPPLVTAPPESILELTLPSEVGLMPGEETEFFVQVKNTSPYLAEEITLRLVELPEGVTAEPGGPAELPAFGQRSLTLTIRAPEGMPQGTYPAKLVLTYHYCIGESCFQMRDEAELMLAVGKEPISPRRPWSPWWLLVLLGVGVALAWLVLGKGASALGIVLMLVAGAAVGVGVYLGQARQAQLIGAVLCTSCVGIEEVRPEVPQVSAATREALAQLSRPVKLVVFHTPWCHSCPFAIAMAQEFARLSPNIDVELVDAEEDLARAQAAGVYRSGRLIVPAVLAPATGQVVFGTRDLEARLLDLVLKGQR